MSAPPGIKPTSAKAEPKTQLGQFYRAHRTEILAGLGLGVAGFAYYRSKHPSSSSSTTSASTASIDPATGEPSGSAADIAALQAQAAGSSAGTVVPDSYGGSVAGDGGGTGYSTGGGYGSDIYSELQTISGQLNTQGQLQQEPPSTTTTPPSTLETNGTSPAIGTPATPAPTAQQTANLANLEAELKKDSAGTTAGDKASVATLNKQIAAVKARS